MSNPPKNLIVTDYQEAGGYNLTLFWSCFRLGNITAPIKPSSKDSRPRVSTAI